MTTMPANNNNNNNNKMSRLSSVLVLTEAADAASSPPPLATLLFAIKNAFLQLDDDEFEAEYAIEQSRRRLPFVHALRNAFLHLPEQEFESVSASERQRRELENSPPPSEDNNNTRSQKLTMIMAGYHAKVGTSKARKSATSSERSATATATADDAVEIADHRDDAAGDRKESIYSIQVDVGRCLNNENNINNSTKQAMCTTTAQPDNTNNNSTTAAGSPTRRSINKKKRTSPLSESEGPLNKKLKKAVFKDPAPYSTLVRSDATTFSVRARPRPRQWLTAAAATTTTTTTTAPAGMAMGAAPPLPNPPLHWMFWNHQPVTVPHNVAAATTAASHANAQGQMAKKYTLADTTLPLAYRAATTGNIVPSLPSNTKKGRMPKSKAAGSRMLTIGQAQTERGEPVPIKPIHQQQPTVSVSGWIPAEDWRLTDLVNKYNKNPVNWEPIAKALGGNRTARECHERWIRYLKPGFRKGQWTAQEDAIVVKAVMDSKEQPFNRWSELADRLPGRVGKQIRDRWINHLNPDINHHPFSRDDDLLLWTAHAKVGKKWVEIAATFFKSSRSENQIKNRWHSAAFKQLIADEFGPHAYDSGVTKSSSSDQSCSSMAEKVKAVSKGQQNVYTASDILLV